MNYFFNKKKIFLLIFSLFLFFAFCFDLQFGLFFFDKKDNNNSFNLSSDIKKIKSPCREVPTESQDSKKLSSSQRIQKLTKLMDTPIDWLFKDIHGNVIDLYCLRGKKMLIVNFWATWCPPCIEELPSLSQLAENNKDKIFVVAISTESLEIITSFLNQSFSDLSPHLKIAQVTQKNKLQRFPKDSLPATYIFNKKGLLKVKELGVRDWSEKNLVQQIINLP